MDIEIDPFRARTHATNICQAADQLTVATAVTFSGNTTIAGNTSVSTTFNSLVTTTSQIQGVLFRDVAAIQHTISSFERMDSQVKNNMLGGLPPL